MTVDHGLGYVRRGLALLPLQACGKAPHFSALERVHGAPEWGPLAKRPATEAEVRGWFDHDPTINLGVICGQVSGGLVAVDVDSPRRARGLRHPATPCVRTSRGWHIYFHSEARVSTVRKPWGEVRGDGAYVALPPSIHESGVQYEWRIGPEDCEFAPFTALRYAGRVPLMEGGRGTQAEVPLPVYLRQPSVDTLACLDQAVVSAMATMGVRDRLGAKFSCILPGHGSDLHPSASLVKGGDNVWRYYDHHHKIDPPTLTLAEVRASREAGQIVRLRAPSQKRWYCRLFHEAGFLSADVGQIHLPDGLSVPAQRAAKGFMLLLALRDVGDGGPAPFTRSFASTWCGMGERQAGEAIHELQRGGVLRVAERDRGMNLYLPEEHVLGARGVVR